MKTDAVFKAYDIRGKVGEELDSRLVRKIGRALACLLETEGAVAVGRDMRSDSKELADALIDGLIEQGRDVVDIGQVTSDMIYFAVGAHGYAGGAVVTASHNPGEYNGIKLCREKARPIGKDTGLMDIKQMVDDNSFVPSNSHGLVKELDVTDEWINHVLSFIDTGMLKPLRIAIDTGNGMAGAIIPHLAKKVPFEITPLYFELDGSFPNHEANPLKPENLQDLISHIKADNLDCGVAFDGDGDRTFLVDDEGEIVSSSVLLSLLAEYYLEELPGAPILYNVICSRIVPETIEELNGIPVRTKVGHSYIKAEMERHKALLGGEHAGHYYFKDNYNADSGLIACMIGLYILSKSDKKLSKLVSKYRKYYSADETSFEIEDVHSTMQYLSQIYRSGKIDWLDGLTVNYEDWWFNVRPSNTEPLIRLNVEAKDAETLEQKYSELKNTLENI